MKKKQLLAALAACTLLPGGAAYAEINEKPKPGVQYDDYVYYDGSGDQNFSFQGATTGETHDYYFNEGATFDASNGSIHAAVLAHNWGEFNEKTAENFHVGRGKNFVIKQYRGYTNLLAEEGATLSITGGNVIVESGIQSTIGMDNTNAAICVEDVGHMKIDSESLWIGNRRNDRDNVGAISVAEANGNEVDIRVENTFTAENVDFGIAMDIQEQGKTVTGIQAGSDIRISSALSDGSNASGYRGAGIYSLAYTATDSTAQTMLTSEKGNIIIDAQGYGIYAYGNTPTLLQANEGKISIHSTQKHGIYSKGYFDENSNKVELYAREIDISADTNYGIYSNNSQIQMGANTAQITGKYGIYASNQGMINVTLDNLTVSGSDTWSIVLFDGSQAELKAKTAAYHNNLYIEASEMKAFADENVVLGQAGAFEGGIITFDSKAQDGTGSASVITTGQDAVTAVFRYV